MTARVLVVGLDAAEPTLLERWADEGVLPTIAALRRAGVGLDLANPMDTLPGAIWPELEIGRSAGRVGHYYHPWQLHTGETSVRPLTQEEIDPSLYYWTVAARGGCKVCVVDQPQSVLARDLPGSLQLVEWGNHDRTFTTASEPPDLLEEIRSRFGDHPIRSCDAYGEDVPARQRLLADLQRAVTAKGEMLLELLSRDEWDLFTATFTESHCVGHQLWSFLDKTSAPGGAPPELSQGIRDIYRRIDAAVGALVERAGGDCVVIVVASHGMGPYVGGPQLVHEALFRLGFVSGGRARRLLPPAARGWLRRRLPSVTGPISRATGLQSRRTRAITLDNNRCAAIRLNLAGREPNGTVRPGPDADALLARIGEELRSLRVPSSGEPIIARVRTSVEAFGPDHHPDLPDLLVSFRTDLGPLVACESPSVGRINAPINPGSTRTGDHTPRSRLWAMGPGVDGLAARPGGNVLDLAPTVLAFLGVPAPDDLDGRPLLAQPTP